VILILPATRHAPLFLAAAGELLAPAFPVPGRRAIELSRAGVDPGGYSIVIVLAVGLRCVGHTRRRRAFGPTQRIS
jgi:hypothetical protein